MQKIMFDDKRYLTQAVLQGRKTMTRRFATAEEIKDFKTGYLTEPNEAGTFVLCDGSLICVGKGNLDWLYSAPHGAGRIMSRKKAKETLALQDFKQSMQGIYTTSVCEETIDEAPMVYKPMQEILAHIQDTVSVLCIIKPLYNFKAKQ